MATQPHNPSQPAILFVPGAWHGPWAFDTIRAELGALGFQTAAATLASVGSTDPNVGLDEDAAAVHVEIEKQIGDDRDVVVVAHSYGGVVASNAVSGLGVRDRAAGGKKGGVVGVVYMAAFCIPAGTGVLDGFDGVIPDWWGITDGFFTALNPANIFYNDVTDTALVDKAVAALGSQPFRIIKDKSKFVPHENGFAVGYIFAEQDNAIPLAIQHSVAAQFPAGSFTASMSTSHSPFLSQPKALAGHINDAVAAFVAQR